MTNNKAVLELVRRTKKLQLKLIIAIETGNTKKINALFKNNRDYIQTWSNKNIKEFYRYKNKTLNNELIIAVNKETVDKLINANQSAQTKILKAIKRGERLDLTNTKTKSKKVLMNDYKLFHTTTKTGRRLRLDYYTGLVAQAALVRARNMAVLDVAEREGYDLVKINNTVNPCPLCIPIQGKIYSISGINSEYPKLPFFNKYLSIHVGCHHYITIYKN